MWLFFLESFYFFLTAVALRTRCRAYKPRAHFGLYKTAFSPRLPTNQYQHAPSLFGTRISTMSHLTPYFNAKLVKGLRGTTTNLYLPRAVPNFLGVPATLELD